MDRIRRDGIWNGDGDERGDGENDGRCEEEVLYATGGRQTNEDGAGDGADAPRDVEHGDETCSCGGNGSAGDDVAGGETCSEAEADKEEGEVRRFKADPGHGCACCGGDGGAVEDAGAEVACGKPGSTELTGEAGGEEGAGLGVLNVPALNEGGQKRAEHDGRDTGGNKVEEDGKERAKRLRMVVERLRFL